MQESPLLQSSPPVAAASCRFASYSGQRWDVTTGGTGHPPSSTAGPADEQSSAPGESDASHGDLSTQSVPRRNLLPAADGLREDTDRQVLVVGDGIVGLALTHLLRRAGYDPLLVAPPRREETHHITYLWPPAGRLLAALGLGQLLRSQGTVVDSVTVQSADAGQEHTTVAPDERPPGRSPAVLFPTRRLRRALEERLPDGQRRQDRTVTAVERRDGGLAVEFGDGIEEWFDLVVATDRPRTSFRPPGTEHSEPAALTHCEFHVEGETLDGGALRDRWLGDALVQRTPCPTESGTILGLTTPRHDLGAVVDEVGDVLADSERAALDVDRARTGPATVRQARFPERDAARSRWGADRVAFCGDAAWPVAPASGFGVSFGLEDALALVSELTRDHPAVANVVDAYAARRSRRVTTVRRRAETARQDHAYPVSQALASPLGTVGVLRTVALGPVLDSRLGSLQRDGFR
ncbi:MULTISPECIES: FAD-dependent oxidoreductase [Salinibaculum]|uniref:FAD-dependent oxidoreductase n=1 Tax=Salinibaculum TaxID=2732368 RepID=UPI0030CB77EB